MVLPGDVEGSRIGVDFDSPEEDDAGRSEVDLQELALPLFWDDQKLRQMVDVLLLFFLEFLEILVQLGKFALSLHRIHTRYKYES